MQEATVFNSSICLQPVVQEESCHEDNNNSSSSHENASVACSSTFTGSSTVSCSIKLDNLENEVIFFKNYLTRNLIPDKEL